MSEYEETVFKNHEELFWEISEFVDLKGKKVVDFGCGPGTGTVALSLKGVDIVGVDNNQVGVYDLITEATKYAVRMGSKATFSLMDSEKINFSDNSVDVVLAIDVLEHLTDPIKVFKEIKRVLKPGGCLIIVWQPYYAPYGGHLRFWSKNPWRQLMPFFNKEKFLKKACQKNSICTYEEALNVFNSLNKLTLGRFRKIVAGMQWGIRIFNKRPFKLNNSVTNTFLERFLRQTLNKLPLIPIVEEFTTQSVLVILRKS